MMARPPGVICWKMVWQMIRKRCFPRLAAGVLSLAAILIGLQAGCPALAAGQSPWSQLSPVVVIDPGHGGADGGLSDPQGNLEKTAVLRLAKDLAGILGSDFKTILTRNDDYSLSPDQRAGLANQARAAAFISLHAGTGKYPNRNSITIFVRKNDAFRQSGFCRGTYSDAPGLWTDNQAAYQEASRRLARSLASCFTRYLPAKVKVVVRQVPVLVLRGVKAPAVMVEMGMLLRGSTSEEHFNQRLLEAFAEALKEFLDTD